MPSGPLEHPGCSTGQEMGGCVVRGSPWLEPGPIVGAWGRRAEVGEAPSWDPRAQLAMEPGLGAGVMSKGEVIKNQKKYNNNKIKNKTHHKKMYNSGEGRGSLCAGPPPPQFLKNRNSREIN